MLMHARRSTLTLVLAALAVIALSARPAAAAQSAEAIDRDAHAALETLYETTPSAKVLGGKARAILVFPNIVKAGFLVGAQYGNGALFKGRKTSGYYNIAAASYGLQAGVQSFGYAMFLMTDSALRHLNKTGGFEIGVGPSVVVLDEGTARTLTTTTMKDDVYAFVFGQRGLMAGVGLQGSKITKISP